MDIGTAEALATFGLLLVGTAIVSGAAHRTVLSIAVLATVAGSALAVGGVLDVRPQATAVIVVVEIVLLVTLFSDGLLVEQAFVRHQWHAPARALVIAMPVNATLLALAAKLLFGDLRWEEAFLLGFILSPTDPVITSSVVSSPHVSRGVRQTLNLESGLNDGLALPFVLLFLALASGEAADVVEAGSDLALESVVGIALGGGIAVLAGLVLDRLPEDAITSRYEGLFALGVGLSAFGVSDLVHGNGLIAAFVAGMALAVRRHEVPEVFHRFNEDLGALLQLVAFVVFGALVVETGFDLNLGALAAFVVFALFAARPASVLLAFVGVRLDRPEKLFIAWFGPKGIASILFALFALNSTAPDRTLVFDVAAATILASIVAHGLTDTVGSRWVSRRLQASA